MKNKKIILLSIGFMISFFVIMSLFEYLFWNNDFGNRDFFRILFTSVFYGVSMGLMIKFKVIKTKNILSE